MYSLEYLLWQYTIYIFDLLEQFGIKIVLCYCFFVFLLNMLCYCFFIPFSSYFFTYFI